MKKVRNALFVLVVAVLTLPVIGQLIPAIGAGIFSGGRSGGG